jgi:hypothetical protein
MRRTCHQASAIGVFHYKRLCVGLYDVNDLGERAAAIFDREVCRTPTTSATSKEASFGMTGTFA